MPVFLDLGTNIAVVCTHLGIGSHRHARFLKELARHDPAVLAGKDRNSPEEADWYDFIQGAGLAYFKYHDRTTYTSAITKLARDGRGRSDERLVEGTPPPEPETAPQPQGYNAPRDLRAV